MSLKHCLLAVVGIMVGSCLARADEVRGVVVKADKDRHELVVEGRGKAARGMVLRLELGKDTEILVGKNKGDMADLAPGKHVRVIFEVDNGRPHAVSVLVRSLPALGVEIMPAAANPSAPPPPVSPPGAGANRVAGTLRRVSYTDREIVVVNAVPRGGPPVETTVQVPPGARITRNQKSISFEDLKEGEPAVVETQKKGNQLVAKSIQAGTAVAAAPAPTPPERRLERVRQILKIIDAALAGLENRQDHQ
jgi:hypothetical protein